MKTPRLYILLASLLLVVSKYGMTQQTTEELINLLVSRQIISQSDADSLRAENAIKAQADNEKRTKFQPFFGRPVTLIGFLQARFLSQQEAGKPDNLEIQRARLDFRATVNEHFDSRMQIDFAGVPRILDAVLNYKYRDWLKVSAGQFFIPFSLDNTTSESKSDISERPLVVDALTARGKDVIGNQNGRDIGIQANGSVGKINDRFLLDYYVGGFNGAGINVPDNNESKDFSGRIVFHPLKNLDMGGSYYNGYGKWGTPTKEHVRKRCGAELSYTYAFASFRGEYIHGLDGAIERNGWYAQLTTYIYKKHIQLAARYDIYDPDIDSEKKGDSSNNRGFGVNFYFNNWSRLQINYMNRTEEIKQVNNDLIAAQFQLSF